MTKKDLESKVQAKVIQIYEEIGYYIIKLGNTNKNGIGDLLCIPLVGSGNKLLFIETKREGLGAEPLQKWRAKEIKEKTGVDTIVIDSVESIPKD